MCIRDSRRRAEATRMHACAIPVLVSALRAGQNVQSAALERPHRYARCARGRNGLLLPHQGHQRDYLN
eukprot:10761314-Alexandrium_andersonii.AAC.1